MLDKDQTNISDLKEWQQKIHGVIFGYQSVAGKMFDIILLLAILASVLVVMLESVKELNIRYGREIRIIEWCFTILFTIEYIARIVSSPKPIRYVFSFMGLVDLMSLIPLSRFVYRWDPCIICHSIY